MPTGSLLGSVVELAAPVSALQAVLVGGYHGGWVPWSPAAGLPHTRQALAPYRAAPGAGVIVALPEGQCGLRFTADIARYLADESAGQCGPCRNGLPSLSAKLDVLAYERPSAGAVREIHRLCGLVEGRGACAHPDGTVRLVASALETFRVEIDHHLHGRCSAHTAVDRARRPA